MKKVLLASLLSFGIASIAQADIGVVKDGSVKLCNGTVYRGEKSLEERRAIKTS